MDRLTTDGILGVYLKEDYSNEFAETQVEDSKPENDNTLEEGLPRIVGEHSIYPFDIKTYSIEGASNGVWSLSNGRAVIRKQDKSSVEIEVVTGRSGSITLIYTNDKLEVQLEISIMSL